MPVMNVRKKTQNRRNSMSGVQFFGEVDRNEKGQISSQFPAWYFEAHVDELKESIARKERSLQRGDIPPDAIPTTKAELAQETVRLDEIMKSKPNVSDTERNLIWKHYKALGKKISDTMFTRSDMMFGTASAHEEAKRMTQPIIELDKDQLALADAIGVKAEDSKVSRNNAAKIFKMLGKLLGEPTNIEVLRKDKATAAGRARTTVH